jgi:leucyl/phenylalanyl-tRNA--protein transferase
LRSLGAIEISRRRYRGLLDKAVAGEADFAKLPVDRPIGGARALKIIAGRE